MVRSPAEEGKDAGTGSGSWPRTPRFAVGDEVEVLFTGSGFRGARFEATVTARFPGSGRYEVVYFELIVRRGAPPLREVVGVSELRPRPPAPQPGREFELFDLVEAYNNDGWWPGVVSDIRPKRRRNQEKRFAVSFPLFREVLELSASFVRHRREFVYGSWIDAQEVLRGIPQYAEGSRVEVMCDKQGRVWRRATIKNMVGGTNYVVSYGNGQSSIEVLHTRFIRPEPIYDKMKLEYELEPLAEVEVYHDGISSLGVIADVGSCEPRRYGVKVKEHNNGDDYMIVSSASLRRKAKRDSQEWRLRSTKKYARKRNYSDSDYSPEFSTPGGNRDQYSSVPNKRVWKENAQTEEVRLSQSLSLRQYTDRSSLKDVMDMEIPFDKTVSRVKKLEIEWEGLGFGVAKEEEQILEANAVKLICTPYDGKGRHSMGKINVENKKTCISTEEAAAFLIAKLEPPSSGQKGVKADLMCIEAPNDNNINVENKKTGISTEEAATFLTAKLEQPSSGQKGVKADLMCIEAPNDSNMEIKNERMGMSLVVAERFHLETCTNSNDIAIVSYPECTASSQHPCAQPLQPVSEKSAGPSSLLHPGVMVDISAFTPLAVPNSSNLSKAFSTTSLLLMPNDKMEVFQKLPQIPHFREAWNCPPELREGRALGLMVCFANMAKSIKDMRIQDEPRLHQEKMSMLLDMEENGFETGPLKVRLHNLLCTRNHHMNIKSRKVRLEKEILEIEAINCGLEQRLKFLDMCIMGMEEKKYQEMKGSLDMQKTENCSLIPKLQVDLCQVEESLKYAEADFCSIATAPWQSHAVPSIP